MTVRKKQITSVRLLIRPVLLSEFDVFTNPLINDKTDLKRHIHDALVTAALGISDREIADNFNDTKLVIYAFRVCLYVDICLAPPIR